MNTADRIEDLKRRRESLASSLAYAESKRDTLAEQINAIVKKYDQKTPEACLTFIKKRKVIYDSKLKGLLDQLESELNKCE